MDEHRDIPEKLPLRGVPRVVTAVIGSLAAALVVLLIAGINPFWFGITAGTYYTILLAGTLAAAVMFALIMPRGKPLGALIAAGSLAAAFTAMMFVSAAYYLGWINTHIMIVNALIQVAILAVAVLFAALSRRPLRELFPVKRPEKVMFIGSLFTYLGVYAFSLAIAYLQSALFPRMAEVSEELGEMATSIPYGLAILSICVMPGICEEALCRGTMLHALRPFRRDWARILATGIMFGILHGDTLRMANTAVLGMGLAYMTIKSANIIYPALWHFANNFISVSLSFLYGLADSAAADTAEPPAAPAPDPDAALTALTEPDIAALTSSTAYATYISLILICAGAGILFLYGGVRRLNRVSLSEMDDAAKKKRRRIRLAGLIVLIAGAAVMLGSCAYTAGRIIRLMDGDTF